MNAKELPEPSPSLVGLHVAYAFPRRCRCTHGRCLAVATHWVCVPDSNKYGAIWEGRCGMHLEVKP